MSDSRATMARVGRIALVGAFLVMLGANERSATAGSLFGAIQREMERNAPYPTPPEELKSDPAGVGMLMVEARITGALKSGWQLHGAVLVKLGEDPELPRKAGPLRNRGPFVRSKNLVLFHDLTPGTYDVVSLRGWNANGQIDFPLVDRPEVEVVAGSVTYVGVVEVRARGLRHPPTVELRYDPESEVRAWSLFQERHTGLPWTSLAAQRIATIRGERQDHPP